MKTAKQLSSRLDGLRQKTASNTTAASGVFGAATGFRQKSEYVANIAAGIASEDSRIMPQVRTDGTQAANRRGLLNSSMAVGAAQDAALRQAVPMPKVLWGAVPAV